MSRRHKKAFGAKSLWKYVWSKTKIASVGANINIDNILNGFSPPTSLYRKDNVFPEKDQDETILSLLKSIARGKSQIKYFDRRAAKAIRSRRRSDLLHLLPIVPDDLDSFFKALDNINLHMSKDALTPFQRTGHPVDLLINDAQNHDILHALQTTYYYCNLSIGRNVLIDVSVIAACLVGVDAFEKIRNIDEFRELIISPLQNMKDIRTQFPSKFQSTQDVIDNFHLGEAHQALLKSQKDKRRRYKILKDLKKKKK
jgi:hypothetical protein